jgi:hypothetical protein
VARELVAGEADAALVVSPLGEVGIVTARDVVTVVAAGGAVTSPVWVTPERSSQVACTPTAAPAA